jgi:hypothetical protein
MVRSLLTFRERFVSETHYPASILPPRHVSCTELRQTEHLIIWAIRRLVETRLHAPDVEAAFSRAMGGAHGRPLILLKTLLGHLAISGKRKVTIGLACRPCLTNDEFALLVAIDAASQGDFVRAHGLFAMIARLEQVDQLTHIAEALGEALRDAGRPISILKRFEVPSVTRH